MDRSGNSRGRSFGRSGGNRGFGNRNSRGFGRDNDRFSQRHESRPLTMHTATCTKCGKECQVPFKPTGAKPVLCSDCFREQGNRSDRGNSSSQGSGVSQEQLNQINAKLDKILLLLQDLEIDVDSDEDSEENEDSEDDSEQSFN